MTWVMRGVLLVVALTAGTPCAATTWVAGDTIRAPNLAAGPVSSSVVPVPVPVPDRTADERGMLVAVTLLVALWLRRRAEPGVGRALSYRATDQIRSPA